MAIGTERYEKNVKCVIVPVCKGDINKPSSKIIKSRQLYNNCYSFGSDCITEITLFNGFFSFF